MKIIGIILMVFLISVSAEKSFENSGARVALKMMEDCMSASTISSCLKKKAITFLDRLGRMKKFPLADGITVIRSVSAAESDKTISENKLENTSARFASDKDDNLNEMLLNNIAKLIESSTIEITMPKLSLSDIGEGRKGGEGGGGGGGGGGKGGMKGMMGGLMMGIAAKMAALIPVAIAGLFLLAGKALITAKIALLLSGIIAIKKLFAAKQGGGDSHGSGWQSSGHGGGWQSGGGGGGWDKRSIPDSHHLAYNAYSPK